MPELYTWQYTVVGDGRFPEDMLRYDRAWIDPADDLLALRQELADPNDAQHFLPERAVIVFGHQEPTTTRWASFGWEVTDVRKHVGARPNPYAVQRNP